MSLVQRRRSGVQTSENRKGVWGKPVACSRGLPGASRQQKSSGSALAGLLILFHHFYICLWLCLCKSLNNCFSFQTY